MSLKNKNLSIKSLIVKTLNENQEPFYYLAPDIIGSINNANLDIDKKEFTVDFVTTDDKKGRLTTSDDCFYNWVQNNKQDEKDNLVRDFLVFFFDNALPMQDEEVSSEENLEEIIDDYGNIMSDDDEPNNANNSMIGKSKFDTDKVVKQTAPKSKRYYSDYGLGLVSW